LIYPEAGILPFADSFLLEELPFTIIMLDMFRFFAVSYPFLTKENDSFFYIGFEILGVTIMADLTEGLWRKMLDCLFESELMVERL